MPDPEMSTASSEELSLFSRRLGSRSLLALDAVAAAGYPLVVMLFSLARKPGPDDPVVELWAVALAIGLPLAFRRRWPVPVLLVVSAATVTSLFTDLAHDSFAAAGYAMYTVALTGSVRWHRLTTGIAVATVVGAVLLTLSGPAGATTTVPGSLVIGAVVLGGTWTLGRAVRDRRAATERAARRLADKQVVRERLHIARELHDVVAHSLSLITVKAAVANHVAQKRPDEAHRALRVIEETSASALAEMRRILGVLRSEDDSAPLAPMPGLAGLPQLVDNAAMAGVTVDLDVTGVGELPDHVGTTVYRIVQEAVTNVVKHAAPARCRVVVADDGDRYRVDVVDDGPGGRVLPPNPDGHGLVGMSERVAMYHGVFRAGPSPDGGFAVHAEIPHEAQEVTR